MILLISWIKLVNSRLWIEGDIRLVGGPRRYMGTVVILHNGRWGAVCDDNWDIKEASVVCRQLGYTLAVRATTQAEFGPGRSKPTLFFFCMTSYSISVFLSVCDFYLFFTAF